MALDVPITGTDPYEEKAHSSRLYLLQIRYEADSKSDFGCPQNLSRGYENQCKGTGVWHLMTRS